MLKNQRGGAAVEFAIVVPLLALILFGTIDFALLFYNKQVLTNASREGARAAIVEENQTNLAFPVQNQIITDYWTNRLICLKTAAMPVSKIEPTDADGTIVTSSDNIIYIIATVTYTYKHFFQLPGFFNLPTETTITGQTVMRSEG